MSTKTEKNCPATGCCDRDYVGKALCKIGVTRSCLITLALVPFAWEGVVWAASAVESLWSLATNAVTN
mgnify:CR=1 FL=1